LLQDVDWDELVSLPQFKGYSKSYLQQILNNVKTATAKSKEGAAKKEVYMDRDLDPPQVTSNDCQKWLTSNSISYDQEGKATLKRKNEIVNLYLKCIPRKKGKQNKAEK